MSVSDVVWLVWLIPALAGAALGLRLRSSLLALLLGFVLVIISFILFGYSIEHYSNNDCQSGEPCPTGEQVIGIIEPVSFLLGSTLVLVAFGRTVWTYGCEVRAWRRRRA
jgi:hypothetical protein